MVADLDINPSEILAYALTLAKDADDHAAYHRLRALNHDPAGLRRALGLEEERVKSHGPPPRPGLVFNEGSHRWERLDGVSSSRAQGVSAAADAVKVGDARVAGVGTLDFGDAPSPPVFDEWGYDDLGHRAYQFRTAAGGEYGIWTSDKQIGDRSVVEVGFHDDAGSRGVTGAGSAAEVFNKATAAVVALVRADRPPVLYFSAEEPSRVRLYDRLTRAAASALPGYTVTTAELLNGGRGYYLTRTGSGKSISPRYDFLSLVTKEGKPPFPGAVFDRTRHRWVQGRTEAPTAQTTTPHAEQARSLAARISEHGPEAVKLAKKVGRKAIEVAVSLHTKAIEAGIEPTKILDDVNAYFNIFRWEGSPLHELTHMRGDVLYSVAPHVIGYGLVKLKQALAKYRGKAAPGDDSAKYELVAHVAGELLRELGIDHTPTADEVREKLETREKSHGAPPRPGLVFNENSHHWERPDGAQPKQTHREWAETVEPSPGVPDMLKLLAETKGPEKSYLRNALMNARINLRTGTLAKDVRPKTNAAHRRTLIDRLATSWEEAANSNKTEAMSLVGRAMQLAGASPIGEPGSEEPYDPIQHEARGAVSKGETVRVSRIGWSLPEGVDGEYQYVPIRAAVVPAGQKDVGELEEKAGPPRPGLVPQTGDMQHPGHWVRPQTGEAHINNDEVIQKPDEDGSYGVKEIDPKRLIHTEEHDAVSDAVRQRYADEDDLPPIVVRVGENGKAEILDGHNRAMLAEERGSSIPYVQITSHEYDELDKAGFGQMEIAYAVHYLEGNHDEASAMDNGVGGYLAGPGRKAYEILLGMRMGQIED